MKKQKIFIACDTTNLAKVRKIISHSLSTEIKIGYKFGLEFMNSKNGRRFVSKLRNKIIFIDLKLNDTVNTMVSAVKALKDLKISYLTVHVSAGLTALRAVKKVSGSIKIIGVTTLTSLNNKDLKLIGYNKSVKNLVIHQARLAKTAGLDALVCSPYEVGTVRKIFKKEIITPGVQIGKKNYDQKRSMEAKYVKSDWLVIGRAITSGNIKKNIQILTKILR
ncbi:MAG: orotidine-5'-phosphate decarboxylase [Pelagibacteraceae bacterium]|jgi:orotidine-5'-phosphate decarboxylase|nr:orotidine-5'-phosphate decarboxylase [Pelagibacteraceae bacterium]|tara:strand:- start:1177 stop:1839 length:663 start_codon:yes stop_codon:yes gene_type:complete